MAGRILNPDALFISISAGAVEKDGVQYELLTSATGSPLVRSKKTLKTWALSWNELFEMAIAAGIESAEPEQATAPHVADTFAARDVLAERRRHIEVEGWPLDHDDEHEGAELAMAAACYAGNAGGYVWSDGWPGEALWPWSRAEWRPTTPRRDLVKAGALILAEIERLDRASAEQEDEVGQ